MKILVLKKGNTERNIITTDEKADAFYEGGYDEIRDITDEGYTFDDIINGKPNTTPNWWYDSDLSDLRTMRAFAGDRPTPYGDKFKDCDVRGRQCFRQFFTNCSMYIVGMGVEE